MVVVFPIAGVIAANSAAMTMAQRSRREREAREQEAREQAEAAKEGEQDRTQGGVR